MRSRSHHVCDVCVSLQHLPRGCDAVPEGHLDQRCHADRFLVYVFISGRGRCCLVAADNAAPPVMCRLREAQAQPAEPAHVGQRHSCRYRSGLRPQHTAALDSGA